MYSTNDKNQLVIDDDTAPIIRMIYEFARNGHGPNYIRRKLEENEIASPVWWNRQKGLRNHVSKYEKQDPERGKYIWDFTTIKEILQNPVYVGSIASQKTLYKFKTGWITDKKPDEWIVVEHCHAPIIDKAVFDVVQEKIKARKRPDAWGNFSLFAGILKCGQCGHSLNVRRANTKSSERIYTCSKYNKLGVSHCSQHRLKYDVIYDIVLQQIQSYARKALEDEKAAAETLQESCNKDSESEKDLIMKIIDEDNARAKTLEKIIILIPKTTKSH